MYRLRNLIDKSLLENKVILDAGTGPRSIEFLASCNPKKIYAVSYNPDEIRDSKNVQPNNSPIEYIEWDISSEKNLDIEKVDVIFAGYFLPAIEGSRPGTLLDSLKRLKKMLNKDGIIIVEDFYWLEKPESEQDKLARELYQITFDSKDLAGLTYPIQMPKDKEVAILKEAGFNILKTEKGIGSQDNKNFLAMHQRRLEGLKKRVETFKENDKPVGEKMTKRAEEIVRRLEEINIPPVYSYDYVIIAE